MGMKILQIKIFYWVIIFFVCRISFVFPNNIQEIVDSAKVAYFKGNLSEVTDDVNQLLKINPDNPNVNILKGLVLLYNGNLEERFQAKTIIEKYTSYLKDDPFSYYALGILYKSQDNYRLARKNFKKAVESNERFVPALIELGENYYQDVLKYYYRYTDTSVPLSYRDYAVEDFDYAVSYLKRAIKYDQKNRSAAYLLGSLYYELEDYNLMLPLFEPFLDFYPKDKDINLFLGLTYLALHRFSDAYTCFKKALDSMSDAERKELLSPEYLIKNIKKFEKVSNFWAAKDPMFLTEENERLLEHFGRFAFANMRFSVPKLKIEGWKTDRGKTYIRYGKPLYIIAYGKNLEMNAIYPPMQIWIYPNFQLAFSDEFLNGLYQYTEPSLDQKSTFKERTTINYTLVAENVFATIPESFDFQLPGGSFRSSYFIKFFKGQTNSDGLLAFSVPAQDTLYEPQQELRSAVFLLDEKNLPIKKFEKKYVINFKSAEKYSDKSLPIRNFFFKSYAGNFNYSFEILNKTLNQNFVDRNEVKIPDFTSDSLLLSDLILADRIDTKSFDNMFFRNNLYILPNILQKYQLGDTLFLYFEIYNLTPNKNFRYQYQVENSIIENKSGGIFNAIFGRGAKKVGFVNDYSGSKSSDFIIQSIALNNLIPGEYNLEIIVRDEISKKMRIATTRFTILETLTD